MSLQTNFSNQFLIGLPGLSGDYFQNTISLLVEHSDQGAFGLVINRPVDISVYELFPEHDLAGITCPVLEGGPVQRDKAFFLHNGDGDNSRTYASTYHVGKGIHLTTSVDLLEDLASGGGPGRVLTLLGYAGWGAGQLELELSENIWLLTESNSEILFETPFDQKANTAAGMLGIDINLMAPSPGHG